jgi:Kdo2-lipid IVA lauroyltransferase/acyltransferase
MRRTGPQLWACAPHLLLQTCLFMPRQIGLVRASLECAALAPLWLPLRFLPLASALRLGGALGPLAMALDRRNRPIAERNLSIAFPDRSNEARLAILRETYRNFGRMAAEWAHLFEITPVNFDRFGRFDGYDHWTEALRIGQGRGLLILTAHVGNFEMLIMVPATRDDRLALVHRPNRNPLIDRMVTARRERFRAIAVPRKGAGRPVLKLLHDNWTVAMPLDLDTRSGVFVDFFGMKAATSDGLARVAMATGAPVLPAFILREGTGPRHVVKILPAIEVLRAGDRGESIRENTQRFTAAIESVVRDNPSQWNWIHRRWKTRPPGEPRFY